MNHPVKILHLSASDTGGAFIFAENLIANTDKKRFLMKHIVFTGLAENFRFISIKFLDHSIKFGLHAVEKFYQFFHEKNKDVRFKFSLGHPGIPFFILKRLVKEYDILHLHWINKGFINIKHLKKLGKPIVWTCHDIWPVTGGCHLSMGCDHFTGHCGNCHFLKSPSDHDLSNLIFEEKKRIYQDLNISFVSPSKWMDKNISSSSLGKEHKHLSIQNGIDTGIFRYSKDRVKSDKITIGFVAANLNDKNKALYRLVEALHALEGKENYRLLLLGKQKSDFDFTIPIEYQIISDIHSKTDMASQYNLMDVLVCSSSIETFPTTLMEAYCCGVPGVGFNVGGVPEIIESMGGKCIEAFNISTLTDTLASIKAGKKEAEAIALKAKAMFGIEKTAESYQSLYTELLSLEG